MREFIKEMERLHLKKNILEAPDPNWVLIL